MHVRKLSSIYGKVTSSQKSHSDETISMHSYKKNTTQACLHAGTPHQTPLLTKKNIKGRLEYAKNKYLNSPLEF